jgi:hypothetical protein
MKHNSALYRHLLFKTPLPSNTDTPQMDSPPKIPSTLQISMSEPALQGVKQEDRSLVRNVIYLLHACKHPERLCVSWNVANTRNGYEVTGFMDSGKDFEILKEHLDMISLADPLRIQSIAIRRTGEATQILIRILSKTEPIMMTELEVLTVQKKRRLL